MSASSNATLTDAQVQEMTAALERHYRDRVMPVREVCAKLKEWAETIEANNKAALTSLGSGWVEHIYDIFGAIAKSSLLGRTLYGGEKLRTRICPEHKGVWCGLEFPDQRCPHGCQLTGWIKEAE